MCASGESGVGFSGHPIASGVLGELESDIVLFVLCFVKWKKGTHNKRLVEEKRRYNLKFEYKWCFLEGFKKVCCFAG
jgi:hypothetical protein